MPKKIDNAKFFETTNAPRVRVEEGEYLVKCVACDNIKSQKGSPMVKLEFEVTEGPAKGGTVKSYIMKNLGDDETQMWKARNLAIAVQAYDIPESRYNTEDVDTLDDLLHEMAVVLNKYIMKDKPQVKGIKMIRKPKGEPNADGKQEWRDFYDFADAESSTNDSTDTKANTKAEEKDDFFDDIDK